MSRINPTILLLLIILTLVALAHVLLGDFEQSIEGDKIEHLVRSDSDYSACEVGCIIACSDKNGTGVLQKECYCPCVDQCWNY